MNIALIGPPGAGKSTHASALKAEFNLAHVSTGNLFRRQLVRHTALGILSRKYIQAGELVPDEVVEAIMEEWLRKERSEAGILFDGFPRTVYQVKFLEDCLRELGQVLAAVIYLNASDRLNIERLAHRLICRTCQTPYHQRLKPPAQEGVCDLCQGPLYHRDGDTPELIKSRLQAFHRVTNPVVRYFETQCKLILISGEGAREEVCAEISGAVRAVMRREIPVASADQVGQLLRSTEGSALPTRERPVCSSFDLVLLGAPGSGKGTQAEQLCKQLKLKHIATGDLFRENLNNATELGKMAKGYMDCGELVPDEITDAMVKDRLARPDIKDGFIMDGFPRNLHQAEALTKMEHALGRRISGVIYIKVSDDEIVGRLSGRVVCRSCQTPYHVKFKRPAREKICDACGGELYQRDDDNCDTVRARLKTFHAQTEPVIDYYRQAGLLSEIDGERDVSAVIASTLSAARKLREEVKSLAQE